MNRDIYQEKVKYQDSFSWYDEMYLLDHEVKLLSKRCMYYNNYDLVYSYFHILMELYDHVYPFLLKIEGNMEELNEIILNKLRETASYNKIKKKYGKIICITKLQELKPIIREYKRLLYQNMKKNNLLILMDQNLHPGHAIRGMEL